MPLYHSCASFSPSLKRARFLSLSTYIYIDLFDFVLILLFEEFDWHYHNFAVKLLDCFETIYISLQQLSRQSLSFFNHSNLFLFLASLIFSSVGPSRSLYINKCITLSLYINPFLPLSLHLCLTLFTLTLSVSLTSP